VAGAADHGGESLGVVERQRAVSWVLMASGVGCGWPLGFRRILSWALSVIDTLNVAVNDGTTQWWAA
jgi:hypothetical protein